MDFSLFSFSLSCFIITFSSHASCLLKIRTFSPSFVFLFFPSLCFFLAVLLLSFIYPFSFTSLTSSHFLLFHYCLLFSFFPVFLSFLYFPLFIHFFHFPNIITLFIVPFMCFCHFQILTSSFFSLFPVFSLFSSSFLPPSLIFFVRCENQNFYHSFSFHAFPSCHSFPVTDSPLFSFSFSSYTFSLHFAFQFSAFIS